MQSACTLPTSPSRTRLMLASSNAYPPHAHVFMKDGRKMSDIVWNDMWDSRWNNKGKVMSTDSRFMHGAPPWRGCARNGQGPQEETKGQEACDMNADTDAMAVGKEGSVDVKECACFPMRCMDDNVRKSVPRGHLQRQAREECSCAKPMASEACLEWMVETWVC